MRRILPLIPVVALAALGAMFWAYSLKKSDPQVQPNALIGKPLPTKAWAPLEGGPPTQTTPLLNGKPGLVNVWFSYCAPCIIEAPRLMQLKQAGVNIVGVTWMDEPGNSQAFLDKYGNPFSRVLVGGEGTPRSSSASPPPRRPSSSIPRAWWSTSTSASSPKPTMPKLVKEVQSLN